MSHVRGGIVGMGVAASLTLLIGMASAEPCPRGTRKTGAKCVEIQLPPNAELDYLGNDWQCKRGYRRVGTSCAVIQVPPNGELNYLGTDWQCKRGFQKAGSACQPVGVPANAELDYLGNGWQCRRGFRRVAAACELIRLPENAELDITGNNWICRRGFKLAGARCVPMTEQERLAQDRAIAAATGHARRLANATCTIGGKPAAGVRAEVAVKKSGCGSYFVAEGPTGNYLLEWYGGYDPDEGDIIIGPIDSYGFKSVCYAGHREGRVYVDDYMLSDSRAADKLAEKCR